MERNTFANTTFFYVHLLPSEAWCDAGEKRVRESFKEVMDFFKKNLFVGVRPKSGSTFLYVSKLPSPKLQFLVQEF